MTVSPNVTFRAAGGLDRALNIRANRMALGYVAKRDLERYYQVLADELRTIELTSAEASLITDALNGVGFFDALSHRFVWAEVADAICLNRADEKWGVDGPALVERLRNLTPAQTLALADAAERFWAGDLDRPTDELLREVGLIRKQA